MEPPLVAVTDSDHRLPIAWWFIRAMLRRSGVQACRLTPRMPHPPRRPDGWVISGGDDIDPALYLPVEPEPRVPADGERDEFELAVLRDVLERDVPVLGICRGSQLLNVALGGTLHADLRTVRKHTSNRRTPFARKTLLVEPDTRLAALLGSTRARINSLHHQAVADLGDGLVVAGRDLDQIVQAIEHPGYRFVLGTQWHPEYLPLHAAQRGIFAGLCAAVRDEGPRDATEGRGVRS